MLHFRVPSPRLISKRLIAFGGCVILLMLYYFKSSNFSGYTDTLFKSRIRGTCPPSAWANGSWQPKNASYTAVNNYDDSMLSGVEDLDPEEEEPDALELAGFEGCASDREYKWHLGTDTRDQWFRFNKYSGVSSYEWVPSEGCMGMRKFEGEALVSDLVQRGGWLLLGDSITEGHFFSLSCLLYPHVRATPNYTENPYFDRAWPQNLYLNPKSPVVKRLVRERKIPMNFDIVGTPIVTFRRIDLLLNSTELEKIQSEHASDKLPLDPNKPLFSDEKYWTLSPTEYMPLFLTPLPDRYYRTLIISTAGHWTTTVFGGLANPDANRGNGIERVMELFKFAMREWADVVQGYLDVDNKDFEKGRGSGMWGGRGSGIVMGEREVIIRAYIPGHENCRNIFEPWRKWVPYTWDWYNWPWIGEFNRIFENVISNGNYSNIHFLPIERPAMLRPDAHATGDCLHILAGPGVLEGWTHYIWQFVTKELPAMIQ